MPQLAYDLELINAASSGNESKTLMLLGLGADPSAIMSKSAKMAAMNGHVDILNRLIGRANADDMENIMYEALGNGNAEGIKTVARHLGENMLMTVRTELEASGNQKLSALLQSCSMLSKHEVDTRRPSMDSL